MSFAPTWHEASEFLTAIVLASFEVTGEITDLLVACSLPELVQSSIKRAMTSRGVDDRRLLLEHAGFLNGPGQTP